MVFMEQYLNSQKKEKNLSDYYYATYHPIFDLQNYNIDLQQFTIFTKE